MKTIISHSLLCVFFLCIYDASYAQGCSDAGACTMSDFRPTTIEFQVLEDAPEPTLNQFKIGANIGGADHDISVWGAYLEYARQVNPKLGLDLKITSLSQSGNGISTSGLSDIFLNANYKASEKFKLSLGTKIPLMKADKSLNNLPLPMDYQSSLGTFDLILGAGYQIQKFQLVVAFQQPLTQNKNMFLSSLYSDSSALHEFQSTRFFQRSPDLIFRASYPFYLGSKFVLTPSILPIIHLGTDKYTDASDQEMEIKGSDGLTLNGNVFLDYKINAKNKLQLSLASPFVVRDVRPDGLTRSFVANLEYSFKF